MPPIWNEPGRALDVLEDVPRAETSHLTYSRTRGCRQFILGKYVFCRAPGELESLGVSFGLEGGDGFDETGDCEGVAYTALADDEVQAAA
jgi:hypothetical protein